MKVSRLRTLILVSFVGSQLQALAADKLRNVWGTERAPIPPPPLSQTAFLTPPMHKWLQNLRTSLSEEWLKESSIEGIDLTVVLDGTEKTQKVEMLKSCGRRTDDQRAVDMVRKMLRPAPDKSLDGSDIIIRFGKIPNVRIEAWNNGVWMSID